jgi:hypothetical protein
MKGLRAGGFVAALVCVGASLAAREARGESLAVLGVEAIDASEATANALTEALRARARDAAGIRLVASKDFMEMKLLYNCMSPSQMAACLAPAGKSLGADKILFGSLTGSKRHRGIKVSLKLVDSSTGQVLKSIDEQVSSVNVDAAARWFAALVPPVKVEPPPVARAGSLMVASTPTDATVTLDGHEVGRTPTQLSLVPGTHTMTVAHEGYEAETRTLAVKSGETRELELALRALPKPPVVRIEPPPVTPPPANPPLVPTPTENPHPGRTLTIIGAIGLVAGLVAIGIEIYTWQTYLSLESKIYDPTSMMGELQLLQTTNPTWAGKNAGWFQHPDCNPPPQVTGPNGLEPGLTSDTYRNYVNDCSRGNTLAGASTGLLVGGIVVGVAGAAALGIGLYQSRHAADVKHARLAPRLKMLGPAFGRAGGGLQASFEF